MMRCGSWVFHPVQVLVADISELLLVPSGLKCLFGSESKKQTGGGVMCKACMTSTMLFPFLHARCITGKKSCFSNLDRDFAQGINRI